MSDAAVAGDQPHWLDPPREQISAPEASMAASVETEPTERWVLAVGADAWPNVANGEDQLETVRTEPAAEDPDVPYRDVAGQHNRRQEEQPAVDDRALAGEQYRRTAAEARNVVAMHPKDDGRRHRP